VTRALNIHGFHQSREKFGRLSLYGSDAPAVQALGAADPTLGAPLDAALPYTGAEVVWAARHEMARTVEDVLARRCRALFLNARSAARMAPTVARLLAHELGYDEAWQRAQVDDFTRLSRQYTL
jgi:glycerol-3-phosphate dehydrogenase